MCVMEFIFDGGNIECALRLIIAGICGGIIGIERTKRNKGAGIRTHMIVAVGAALFVIVSKYGFTDVVYIEGAQVDVARVASNIVSGVSFLGAGMIFMRGDSVQGLTTAAGIWTTAAIGLSVGTGMYIVGLFGTFLILMLQIMMHRGFIQGLENVSTSKVVVSMGNDPAALNELETIFSEHKVSIVGSHVKRRKDGNFTYTLDVKMPKDLAPTDILAILKDCKDVSSIGV